MTIVGFTAIHPNPGVKWEDVQKQIKKACDLARKHGAENVTVLVTMVGGPATNTIGVLSTTEDWAKYGTVQKALLDDPKNAGRLARGWPDRHMGDVCESDDPGHVARHVIRDRHPSAGVR